ncbi:hypothetical protein G7Y89_g2881 [Cudoniella acicularis]|uniref:Tyrosinase copper-binding domain-containing protein n=1 Tax=Cudoniella acicularis TaxID=354080 RepID=A0A8H4RSF8_9HELO|nr:hypothetical protein G7Y89_g2881 [Cudoniella acicularis]
MKTFISSILLSLHLAHATPLNLPSSPKAQYDIYRARAYENQIAILAQRGRDSDCTLENVIVRKEWHVFPFFSEPQYFDINWENRSTLTLGERKEYTDAVNCLRKLPPISPPEVVPGARSRFDDFHASHINATSWVHVSTYFLPWHRYLQSAYENALRDECGYTGGHPYWDWSAGDATPGSNVLFSGGEGSIGGNGEKIKHNASVVTVPTVPPRVGLIPPGTGGGCVTDGPFANMIINLGPFGPPQSTTAFTYNPRCVTRDFRPGSTNNTMNYSNITSMLSQPNLHDFQALMEGVHASGHVGIGGLNDDLYAGTGDPAFWFHHAQVDHTWTVWQWLVLDSGERMREVTDTLTFANSPPSANGTLDTVMDIGYNGGPRPMRDLAETSKNATWVKEYKFSQLLNV